MAQRALNSESINFDDLGNDTKRRVENDHTIFEHFVTNGGRGSVFRLGMVVGKKVDVKRGGSTLSIIW